VKLTAAAAAASTHNPAAALRSHRPERSRAGPGHPGPETLPVLRTCGTDGPSRPVSTSGRRGTMGPAPGL
jgi:hypothetical protein